MTTKGRALLASLALLFAGQPMPEVRRIRRGETAGEARRNRPAHIQTQPIERAQAKRARKAAIRLKQRGSAL